MTDTPDAEAFRRRFADHDPQRGHDTGGTPWAGRQLTSTGFDGDTGEADDVLLRAMQEHRAAGDEVTAAAGASAAGDAASAGASDGPQDPESADLRLMEALTDARLMVPVVAVAGEMTEVDGLVSDASSDMAAVTLVAPDGQRALPAFTSLAALAQWDSSARPVPVTPQRAAQAAVQEGCHVIVLDPGLPGGTTLRGSMVWALAMGRNWLPAHRDPQVRQALEAAARTEPQVSSVQLSGGPHGVLTITLALRPGLEAEGVRDLVQRLGEQVATDGEVRARIDAINFALRAD